MKKENDFILEELRYIRTRVDEINKDMINLRVKIAVISIFFGVLGSKIELLGNIFK